MTEVDFEREGWGEGLRETFLTGLGLPAELRESLQGLVREVARLAERSGLLHADSRLEPEDAQVVGLWKELDHLKQLAGKLERKTTGERRERMRDVRVLLEESIAQAALALPEGDS